MLEDALSEYLKSQLRMVKQTERLFEKNGPLSSFDGKNKIAFAMELISDDVYFDLDKVREIRNKFAHWVLENGSPVALTFATDTIKDQCKVLRYPEVYPPTLGDKKIRQWFAAGIPQGAQFLDGDFTTFEEPPSDPRERFVLTCSGLTNQFRAASSTISKPPRFKLHYSSGPSLPLFSPTENGSNQNLSPMFPMNLNELVPYKPPQPQN